MLKINLGSGDAPLDGYVNVDVKPHAPKADIVHDLDCYPWPFESDSADEILSQT